MDACNPVYCTYTVAEKRSAIVLITTLVGVFSGLNVAMKLIVSLVMKSLYQCFHNAQGIYVMINPLPLIVKNTNRNVFWYPD